MIIFILILSILILVHELGHFLAARQLGIRVEKFSLGFGPKLLSKKQGETEYMLCAIPFGGFVKLAGDTREELTGKEDEFLGRSVGHRARVIAAGSIFNYILAFLCLWLVFFFGFPRFTTVIGELVPNMPAQKSGLLTGDKILEIDGEKVAFWEDITKRIYAKKGEPLSLKVLRGSSELQYTLTPEQKQLPSVLGKKVEVGLIGIKPSDNIITVRYGFWVACGKAIVNLLQMTYMTLVSIFYILIGAMSLKESFTGPIGIFFAATGAAKIGFSAVVHLIAVLGMSLAIFNLLPFPVLDGGYLALLGLEKLRKKTLSPKVENVIMNTGASFLIVLAVFIFGNDLVRYGYFDKLLGLFIKK
jgi:regulator of sigma E protease